MRAAGRPLPETAQPLAIRFWQFQLSIGDFSRIGQSGMAPSYSSSQLRLSTSASSPSPYPHFMHPEILPSAARHHPPDR